MLLDLIVARYNENLNWLRRVPKSLRVTVYDKSGENTPNAIVLPNIGREAHTYLWHIVENYAALAEMTIFCQGKPFDHAYDFHQSLRNLAETPVSDGFLPLGHIVDTDNARGQWLFTRWSKNQDGHELDMRGFHRALFGNEGPEEYTFRLGAQFGVTRQIIRNRPREFYERALQVAINFPDAAHCFERSWPLFFGAANPDLAWLEGRKTAYLKPIRRLANE